MNSSKPTSHTAYSLLPVLLLLCTYFFPKKIKAQQLFPGDIAVLGVSANTFQCNGISGADAISFVCFKDIKTGMTIDVTDNGWERCYPGRWSDREGVLRFTRTGTTIPAGTVITWQITNTGAWGTYSFVSPDNDWQVENLNTAVALPTPLNLNAGGDQLWFLQGGNWENSHAPSDNQAIYTGQVLFGINTKSTWTPVCQGPTATQNSAKHPEAAACNSIVQTLSSDFAKYTGDLSPTDQLTWLNRIHKNSNWTRYTSCMAYAQATPNLEALTLTITTLPAQVVSNNSHICAGDSLYVRLDLPLFGGPFDVGIRLNNEEVVFTSIETGYEIGLLPDTSVQISIHALADSLGCSVQSDFSQQTSIFLHQPDTTFIVKRSCFSFDTIFSITHNQYGCDSTTIEIPELAAPISYTIDSSDFNGYAISCYGEADGRLSIQPVGGFAPLEVTWSDGTVENTRITLAADTYAFSINDSIGCSSTGAIRIHQPSPILRDFSIEKASCAQQSDAQMQLKTITGGVEPYVFSLNGAGFTTDTIWIGLPAHTASVLIEDANGCRDSTQLNIKADEKLDSLPLIDTLIEAGRAFLVPFPYSIDSFVAYNHAERVHLKDSNTLLFDTPTGAFFEGIIKPTDGCPSYFGLRLRLKTDVPYYAPNILHLNDPNSQNAEFRLHYDNKKVQSLDYLKIYDRYGALLFEGNSTKLNNDTWDGTTNGRPVQTGTYIWKARLSLWDGTYRQIQGDITVLP